MVVSLCAAIGLHWVALQSMAWAGMLLDYSRGGSVVAAVEKTFDGAHPCPLCNAIQKAQGAERSGKKQQDFQAGGKIDMDCAKQSVTMIPPMRDFSWPDFRQDGAVRFGEPRIRPPRVG